MENADLVSNLGKPLRYCDLEVAISNADGAAGRAQLLTARNSEFDDQLLYFLLADTLREKLREVMEAMPDSDFGYTKIAPDQIGSPRRERHLAINDLRVERASLQQQKAKIEQQLLEIGFPVPRQDKGTV